MNYEIVKYTSDFKTQVVDLQRHLWGPDSDVNTAYLDWKHLSNPYLDEPLIYLALSGAEVVGMRGFFGARWQLGHAPDTWLAPCAGDTVVSPEHRTQGLFAEITRAAFNDLSRRDCPYAFNLSASPTTYLSSLATGWRGTGWLEPLQVKASGTARATELAERRATFDLLDTHRVRSGVSCPVTVEATVRPTEMAQLVERVEGEARLRHVRDSAYFAWRFQNPRSIYRFLYWHAHQLEGYLVLRVPSDPEKAKKNGVAIVDWEATGARAREDLLKAAMQWGQFDRLTIWSATLRQEIKALLHEAGFRLAERKSGFARSLPTLLVRPVHDEMRGSNWTLGKRRVLDLQNWDLRMICSDGQ